MRWNIRSSDPEQIQLLSSQLKVSPLIAHLLIQRGFADPEQARKFLNPRLEELHDPYLMKDMDGVVERVMQARDQGEKILIYGDYDVDGMTSTVVLKRALEMLGISADFYLPWRLKEGYGVKTDVLRKAYADGYRLVITLDSGIRAFEEADVARELGLHFIVVDHHLPDRSLPSAYAILNPHRQDCNYPDKNLAAVGVVFKLVQALLGKVGRESVLRHFLKLVAIGTVADVVPLIGENRIIVRYGLEGLADPRNPGLRALLSGAGVSREVNLFDVAFKLAPRINAVTRMGGHHEVVDLFFLDDHSDARKIVQEMNTKNSLRQQEERGILAEIEERFKQDPDSFKKKFLVVAGRHWHRGVIGIVASRLVERFYRPVLVLSIEDSFCQGSGRSIPGFNLLEAFDHCQELFAQYGGHAQAVGCTLDERFCESQKINELAHRLEAYTASKLSPEELIPSLRIESCLSPDEISFSLYEEIQQLAPFGTRNPVPVFASKEVNVVGGPWVLKGRHLKLQVRCDGSRVDAIWWRKGALADTISAGSRVDLAYTMSRDSYLGEEKLLLTIRDLHLP
ncbi:single-stranded-DNA-specific exonuclease RecJ [Acidobacteria bacterium AH-259-L09]|nr:single-stranded-DNA-specific exonuclease RecJ [Acidobacteria bacterium AH-259-L09]